MKSFYIFVLFLICLSPAFCDLKPKDLHKRLKLDYGLTEAALYQKLQDYIVNLKPAEFKQWLAEGRFENKIIEGNKYYFNRAIDNLFFRNSNLNKRNLKYKPQKEVYKRLLAHIRKIKKQKIVTKKFRVKMQVSFSKKFSRLRTWLPMPASYNLIDSSHKIKLISSPKEHLQAAYLEAENSSEIWLKYDYQNSGIYFQKILDEDLDSKFLKENLPHIAFTQEIRALSSQILKNNSSNNNLEKAQKFYNWISENIRYSFAPEYSTISNLSQTCLNNLYGDCGQAAFLFITLCRLNGVPARWQSGVWHFQGKQTIHDWAAIYIKPYGWIPVDPYMGMQAMQYSELSLEDKLELKDFYFGGLDTYRLLVNTDNNVMLKPNKCSIRSDEVDFQRGEFESDCQNIYFDQFKYNYSFEEII